MSILKAKYLYKAAKRKQMLETTKRKRYKSTHSVNMLDRLVKIHARVANWFKHSQRQVTENQYDTCEIYSSSNEV